MTARVRRFARAHWLGLFAILSLLAVVLAVDPRQVLAGLDRIRPELLVAMAAAVLASYALRGLAWWVALRRLGVRAGAGRVLRIELAGQAITLMPAADLARATLLRRASRSAREAPATTVAATIVVQEFVFIALLGVAALPEALIAGGAALLLTLVLLAGVALVSAALLSERALELAVRALAAIAPRRGWARMLQGLGAPIRRLLDARTLAELLSIQAVAVVLNALLFWLALAAVGAIDVNPLLAAYALTVGSFFSGASLVPLGLGVFEASVTVLLAGAGVQAAEAAAAGILYRTFNDLFMAGVGALLLVGRRAFRPDLFAKAPHPGRPKRAPFAKAD